MLLARIPVVELGKTIEYSFTCGLHDACSTFRWDFFFWCTNVECELSRGVTEGVILTVYTVKWNEGQIVNVKKLQLFNPCPSLAPRFHLLLDGFPTAQRVSPVKMLLLRLLLVIPNLGCKILWKVKDCSGIYQVFIARTLCHFSRMLGLRTRLVPVMETIPKPGSDLLWANINQCKESLDR